MGLLLPFDLPAATNLIVADPTLKTDATHIARTEEVGHAVHAARLLNRRESLRIDDDEPGVG
ncbi:hypothetical protein NZK35_26305 [Stieleria sp. ICT_E10.1]|uniref:hypothetical protein n=1 Tax=Stieleria sedimenti TaxID=2976331 RepID=UPI00217F54EC|nr:hypothetical protein [Stieleria sedimenti]MCS7470174.1 hypothetical protein [Stieleria sedimenti]